MNATVMGVIVTRATAVGVTAVDAGVDVMDAGVMRAAAVGVTAVDAGVVG